jgi:hypothetical protein
VEPDEGECLVHEHLLNLEVVGYKKCRKSDGKRSADDDSATRGRVSSYTLTLGGRFKLVRAPFAEYHMILATCLSSHPNSFRNPTFLSAKVSLQIEYYCKPFINRESMQ